MDTKDSGEGPDHGAGATYLLLGPPAVRTSAGVQHVRGRLQSTLFTWLALRAGQPVDSERLIDVLWAEAPPADAVNALQSQVSRLRLLTGSRLVRFGSGSYQLDAPPGSVDVHVFESLLGAARRQHERGAYVDARHTVEDALGLWRGRPFPELPDSELAGLEGVRLEELRLQALVLRVEADLALRRHGSAIITLRHLTAEHPLREDMWALLMLALYRAGRVADALAAYRGARATLVRELGIEPCPQLRELERAVLRHDPDLAGPPHPCGGRGAECALSGGPVGAHSDEVDLRPGEVRSEALDAERRDVDEGTPPEDEVTDDLPDCGRLQEPVAREAGGVQESVHRWSFADQRIVVGGDLVQPRPPAADTHVGDRGGAVLHHLRQPGQPGIGERDIEARPLVGVRHAEQQAPTFAVEVERAREVDRHGQPRRQPGDRLGEQDLPTQGYDWQCDSGQGPDNQIDATNHGLRLPRIGPSRHPPGR